MHNTFSWCLLNKAQRTLLIEFLSQREMQVEVQNADGLIDELQNVKSRVDVNCFFILR